MSKTIKFITSNIFTTVIWFALSFFAVINQAFRPSSNNYQVYKYAFINLIHQANLYTPQPEHFLDLNHYGPLFALLIAPFTFFPDGLGSIIWTMTNAFVLYKAIHMLPLTLNQRCAVVLICAHECMTSSFGTQINPMVAAGIIFSFVLIKNKQDFWAALAIVAGIYIKIYGIVGLAFFFFSQNKFNLIKGLVFWGLLLFILPMPFSSPGFVMQSYHDWYISLSEKNASNAFTIMQDTSVMGMIRKIFQYPQLPNLLVLIPAIVIFATSYLNIKSFNKTTYQLLVLSSTLIFTVIFSTSSESPTYIIAFVGVGIWFINLDRPVTRLEVALLVFALIITSFSPSDLFPKYINKTYIKPYALKALPCFLIWLKIVYETVSRNFLATPSATKLNDV
ncbi:MAG: glycosyltransferase family 87 protein [Janthinobacterium lividum]